MKQLFNILQKPTEAIGNCNRQEVIQMNTALQRNPNKLMNVFFPLLNVIGKKASKKPSVLTPTQT